MRWCFGHGPGGILEACREVLWPTRCVGCDATGILLCPDCEAKLPLIDRASACPSCGAPFGSLVCTECAAITAEKPFPFAATRAVGTFEDTLARMLTIYKDEGERRLCAPIARLLAQAAGEDWRIWADLVVFVPASPKAFRRRGFDHMADIADEMAGMCHLEVCDALVCKGKADQRLLGREERADNVEGAFRLVDCMGPLLAGRNVLLIDDVFTTGATLSAASEALSKASVREIRVVVAARVW